MEQITNESMKVKGSESALKIIDRRPMSFGDPWVDLAKLVQYYN